ncbi:hypothetical protein [Sphingobium chungbukense]|uniref:hypothetical protein n=1 Tax=Sphingobium chungbukense TaxID=56193 RepID=UPI0012ECE080|nr:hypothetical protein [Sphingobium chungbukense]
METAKFIGPAIGWRFADRYKIPRMLRHEDGAQSPSRQWRGRNKPIGLALAAIDKMDKGGVHR